MQVRKQNVNIGKTVYEGEVRTSAEGSIIVPDVKADILKILQVDAEAFLSEKQIDSGKVTFRGRVNVNVLYLPESGGCSVECIKGCFDFCETVKNSEFEPEMTLSAVCEAEKIGYKLINSRKVGIDAKIVISARVGAKRECDFVCGVEDEAEIKTEKICIRGANTCREFPFTIEETVDFPRGRSDISEILKTNIIITDKEYRALSEKLVVKGKANAAVLYIDESGACGHCNFELPFTEVFDIEGLKEDAECDISYSLCNSDFSISTSMTGDGKCIAISADFTACVSCEEQREVVAVSDCYLTDRECILKREKIECNRVIAKPAFSAVMKEILEKPEGAPDISSIYTVVAKPYITSTGVQKGKIAVSGKTVVYIMYTAESPQSPVCSINEEIPFSYMVDCESVERDTEILLNIECEHISYTISAANSVEIRCGMCISGKVVKKSVYEVICDIEEAELAREDCGLIIYFVKPGDNLWDVAKHYHVTRESILLGNNLEEGAELIAGEKLIIPIGR